MKKLLFLVLMVSSSNLLAQPRKLSDRATLSLITCGPTQAELYSAFGHSAFRVQDPLRGIDELYNYGMFDFNQPHFYLNFARGYLYYQLGVYNYPDFRDYYVYNNRFVHEQVLNLSQQQLQDVYDYLQNNALPEHKNYIYDYFYNNCATKLRDVLVDVLKDSVQFDGSYVTSHYTIRELTDLYLSQQKWGDLGIDICLGLPMDKKASPFEYMFLPDYLESGFDHATIHKNGVTEPLVKEKILVYESRAEEVTSSGLFQPLYVFGFFAVLAVAISIFDLLRKKLSIWFDCILFGVTGLLGLLLITLWLATDHKAAAYNFNILWALPTNVIVVFAFIRQPRWLQHYFLVTAIISFLLILFWFEIPQKIHYSLMPLLIAIVVRSFVEYWIRKKNSTLERVP